METVRRFCSYPDARLDWFLKPARYGKASVAATNGKQLLVARVSPKDRARVPNQANKALEAACLDATSIEPTTKASANALLAWARKASRSRGTPVSVVDTTVDAKLLIESLEILRVRGELLLGTSNNPKSLLVGQTNWRLLVCSYSDVPVARWGAEGIA